MKKENEKQEKSKCCHAPVKVIGMNDFIGTEDIGTLHYECEKCGKPCDAILPLREENWEIEFDKLLGDALKIVLKEEAIDIEDIKSFIRQLLEKQKQEILEKIKLDKRVLMSEEIKEIMRGFEPTSEQQERINYDIRSQGYNQAVEDLEQLKEKLKT